MKLYRSERGQTLVLIILAVVGMFGFAALAVDLGRVFAERRRAQSAADSAAFAAAMGPIRGVDWATAALEQASLNDYVDPNPNENLDQRIDVQVYHPPISGPYSASAPNPRDDFEEYYQVIIRTQVDPVFGQFVFSGLMVQTVESVARAQPFKAMYPGDALVATNPNACKAVWFQGNAGTIINGGNVFSNSDRTGNPSSCDSGVQNGSGSVTINNGNVSTVGTFDAAGGVYASGGIQQYTDHKNGPDLPIPDCFNDPNFQNRIYTKGGGSGPDVLLPGYYAGGIKITGGDVEMTSGMYCLQGDFTMNGGTIRDIPDPVTGRRGVFIVMLDGDFDISGNVVVNINRMSAFTDYSGQDWHGMLLYMTDKNPWNNTGKVRLGGTGTSTYAGTVFAPGPAHSGYKCTIQGNSGSIGISSNVICNTIYVTGNATVKINYKPEQNYRQSPKIDLSQ